MNTPRGIRNNNPGNIEHNPKNKWQGLADPPFEIDVNPPRFARFTKPEYGIRAIAALINVYFDRYKCDTVSKIISRWAPAVENNTHSYTNAVCSAVGVSADEKINPHEYKIMRPIVEAIIQHENGIQPYSTAKINQALHLAGIAPQTQTAKVKSAISSKTIQGVGVSGTAGAIIAAEQIAATARDASSAVNPGSIISTVLTILIVAGTIFAIYYRLKTKKQTGV